MKKLTLAMTAVAAFGGSALAADLPAYTKAPPMVQSPPSWTGFYVFGGGGGGLWHADGNIVANPGGLVTAGGTIPGGAAVTRDVRTGGSGWFGTVGAGYDWQFNGPWVAGVFADGQFGSISGSILDFLTLSEGTETLRDSWAAGLRFGYLVAPNVYSYVNGGYTGSQWSGATLSGIVAGTLFVTSTPSFNRDGWFVGGGVENSLNIFGISAPGWFMKTEYRAAYFGRIALPETVIAGPGLGPTGFSETFKPWVQTISTSLVYRFNSTGPAADGPARIYTKAPAAMAPMMSWTGLYVFGGAGGGLWEADGNVVNTGSGVALSRDVRTGGHGWFGTVGAGYDWQFNGPWVAGVFADGQFGSLSGSMIDSALLEGSETLRNSWAAGVRLGYLVAPNVYSYINGGYTGSHWSGAVFQTVVAPGLGGAPFVLSTPSFNRDGWFVGGGVENSLNIFGISAPGWFMKTEYRAAFFDRIALPETAIVASPQNGVALGPTGFSDTFKPVVQTVSTSLVYRFNWTGAPVAAKY